MYRQNIIKWQLTKPLNNQSTIHTYFESVYTKSHKLFVTHSPCVWLIIAKLISVIVTSVSTKDIKPWMSRRYGEDPTSLIKLLANAGHLPSTTCSCAVLDNYYVPALAARLYNYMLTLWYFINYWTRMNYWIR